MVPATDCRRGVRLLRGSGMANGVCARVGGRRRCFEPGASRRKCVTNFETDPRISSRVVPLTSMCAMRCVLARWCSVGVCVAHPPRLRTVSCLCEEPCCAGPRRSCVVGGRGGFGKPLPKWPLKWDAACPWAAAPVTLTTMGTTSSVASVEAMPSLTDHYFSPVSAPDPSSMLTKV